MKLAPKFANYTATELSSELIDDLTKAVEELNKFGSSSVDTFGVYVLTDDSEEITVLSRNEMNLNNPLDGYGLSADEYKAAMIGAAEDHIRLLYLTPNGRGACDVLLVE